MPSLKITPVPFRSSNLAIPPSPFSPCSPLAPALQPKTSDYTARPACTVTEPPKVTPLLWMWQCHQCRQTYPLGATRRCLDDGHYFCSGITLTESRRRSNRKAYKRHRACASEFDYTTWKAFGEWRQGCLTPAPRSRKPGKDCWHSCNYPSACRWGNKFGQGQVSPMIPRSTLLSSSPKERKHTQVKPSSPEATIDLLLQVINRPTATLQALLSPSSKRKAATADKSPLSLNTILEDVDEDREIIMSDAELVPSLLATETVVEEIDTALSSADLSVHLYRSSA